MLRSLVVAGLVLAASVARAGPPPPLSGPTPVAIPVGAPVALDGLVLSGEWSEAARCPTSDGGPEIRMVQQRGTWLLALGTNAPWPANGRLTIYARAGDEDGSIRSKGTVWIDLEPREHNRPHALVRVWNEASGDWAPIEGQVVVRFGDVDRRATAEVAISLSLLGIAKAKPPPLRWFAILTSPGGAPNYRTFPFPLDLAGKDAQSLGPDLASTARWAVTTEWPRADGPGAYSPKDWGALVAEDAELTRLGTTAFDLALTLDGGVGLTGTGERPKVDGAIERIILDNFRAIAAKEPLTHAELRAMGRALLELNRAPEAAALLESVTLARVGPGEAEDFDLLGRALFACERFEAAAKAYEGVAERALPRLADGFRATAAKIRGIGAAFDEETKARTEDAAKADLPIARLSTSKGDVLLRLLEDDVPQAVAQFVHLAEEAKDDKGGPFYAGTLFHRVFAGSIAQGGDPTSREKGCEAAGTGGPAWWIAPETNARHRCFRGAVAFALSAEARVGSQFFVMTGPKPDLHKGGMPIFATVIAGMDVVDRLETCDRILAVEILRKRPHPYVPAKLK
jgi:cyclophilin family peptidyl-prolyl cis-trans isomerase